MKPAGQFPEVRAPIATHHDPSREYDSLTGLPNYGLFRDCLARALERAERTRAELQVAVLDLDQFKRVNAWLGHDAGDSVLQEVAWRLSRASGHATVIARENADKFMLLLECPQATAEAELSSLLAGVFSRPFGGGDGRLHLTCCIGLAGYPRNGRSPHALLVAADWALACARRSGPGTLRSASPASADSDQQRFRLGLTLHDALARDALRVHYQPQVDLATGRITGVEALVRWTNQDGVAVCAATLVEAAEECGLICALGDWVLRTACRQLVQWHRLGYADLRVAVNISARQVGAAGLAASVLRALDDTGLAPSFLDLELTESVLMSDIDQMRDCLAALQRSGIRLCLDDFGTGYSSLAYLRSLPIEVLKVDRTFLQDVPDVAAARAIIDAIIAMAHQLQMRVVAEGVENEAQYRYLKAAGCDDAQGYLLCVPLAADDLTALLLQRRNLWPI